MIEKLIRDNPYIFLQIEDFYDLLRKYNLSDTEIKTAQLVQSTDLASTDFPDIWIRYFIPSTNVCMNRNWKNVSIPKDELTKILRDKKIDEIFKF